MNNNILFHDNKIWQNYDSTGFISKKVEFIKKIIPFDVNSIIDLGCGNGLITNELNELYNRVVGVDISKEALSFIKGKSICCNCNSIPVENNSFDLVFSSEMLEHLENDTLSTTIEEMKRISSKYILITVPNNEILISSFLKCNNCGNKFHQSGHLQKLSIQKLTKFFGKDYLKVNSGYFGPVVSRKYEILSTFKFNFLNQSIMPGKFAICPECLNTNFKLPKSNIITKSINFINNYTTGSKKYWIFVLLKKKNYA